jgi:hypothetical protein
LHFEKDIVDCIEFGTKEDFLEISKLLSTKKIEKTEVRKREDVGKSKLIKKK